MVNLLIYFQIKDSRSWQDVDDCCSTERYDYAFTQKYKTQFINEHYLIQIYMGDRPNNSSLASHVPWLYLQ